jgi:hypothetical protein
MFRKAGCRPPPLAICQQTRDGGNRAAILAARSHWFIRGRMAF